MKRQNVVNRGGHTESSTAIYVQVQQLHCEPKKHTKMFCHIF